jgi:hypothetical protein
LAPLFQGSGLQDVSVHPNFDDGARPGSYANGTKSNKIDYVLCSPLIAKMIGGGVFRRGIWGGVNGALFPHYDSITKAAEAASDHAAVLGGVQRVA